MKIAIYSGNIPSTTFIENLTDGLSQAGYKIYLFGKLVRKIGERENVKVFPTPVKNIQLLIFVIKESLVLLFKNPKLLTKSVKVFLKKKKSLKSFFREAGMMLPILNNEPDIFHIQWAKTVEQHPELFSLLKSKTALSLRGAHINYSPISDSNLADAYKKYFPSINGFHAVSEAIAKESVKYGADKNKIKVIYSSVRDELLNSEAKFYTDKTLEIISIGRFHWKKGYQYALDAMKILKDEGINFNYTIVANGEMTEELIFLLDLYDLSDFVIVIPGMEYLSLIRKLQSSHILLLPSVEEGIANVVLEAMAIGVPVITTDCGGMNEAVKNNYNGYIISVRQPALIADRIKDYLGSENQFRKNLSDNAKQTIKEKFTREKQIKEFSIFYNSLMKE